MIETERLHLRKWRSEDAESLVRLHEDKRVTQYLRVGMDMQSAKDFIAWANAAIECDNFGFWAACLKETDELIGFIGISTLTFEAPFTPCVEIGWRLNAEHWGKGYATEGAQASLAYGFLQQGLEEILAFTVPANQRSRRVMEKLGMTHNPADNFYHPLIQVDHPLSLHVLYRLNKTRWQMLKEHC